MPGSTTTPPAVRKATAQELGPLCDTFAAAFYADPLMSWVFPDADERLSRLRGVFDAIARATFPRGRIETVPGEHAGAIWVPPDAEVDEAAMMEEMLVGAGPHEDRIRALFELIDPEHPQDAPHHYLFVLGTRPEWQSHGLGSALLRSVLDPADADGVPAYLEASSERNRLLYLRHGFEVIKTVWMPDGPPVWCMWREPR